MLSSSALMGSSDNGASRPITALAIWVRERERERDGNELQREQESEWKTEESVFVVEKVCCSVHCAHATWARATHLTPRIFHCFLFLFL